MKVLFWYAYKMVMREDENICQRLKKGGTVLRIIIAGFPSRLCCIVLDIIDCFLLVRTNTRYFYDRYIDKHNHKHIYTQHIYTHLCTPKQGSDNIHLRQMFLLRTIKYLAFTVYFKNIA